MLAGKRSGYVIILLGSLLGLIVPVIHMKGAGVGGAIAKSSGAFFFIWTLLALGVTALFSVILSARGLWEHLHGGPPCSTNKVPLREALICAAEGALRGAEAPLFLGISRARPCIQQDQDQKQRTRVPTPFGRA